MSVGATIKWPLTQETVSSGREYKGWTKSYQQIHSHWLSDEIWNSSTVKPFDRVDMAANIFSSNLYCNLFLSLI